MKEGSKRICLVDDDSVYRFAAKKMLQKIDMNHEVVMFEDGEEALEYLVEHAKDSAQLPDYLMLDLRMKHMDGFGFLAEFSKLRDHLSRHIALYVVSSSVDPSDIAKINSYGIVKQYITKPVSGRTFQHILEAE